MSPAILFRRVAVAEAVTWGLLLLGMFLKYVTETTELGVRIFGMVHGVVFIAYCLVTVLVAVDRRWSAGRTLLGLACAVPPFLTLWFERYAARRGAFADRAETRADWRLRSAEPQGPLEHLTAWLVRRPLQGAVAGVVAVAALTGVALVVGPPVG